MRVNHTPRGKTKKYKMNYNYLGFEEPSAKNKYKLVTLAETYNKLADAQLHTLLNMDFEEYYKKQEQIMNVWIKDKKCECCLNPRVISGEIVPNCQHLKEEWKKRLAGLDAKINAKLAILTYRRFNGIGRLDTLKSFLEESNGK